MKLRVNKDVCIGCGACQAICPEVFQIDEDGLAIAKAEPNEKNIEDAMDAKEGCPVSAIEENKEEDK